MAGITECLTASQVFKAISLDVIDQALSTSDRRTRKLGAFPDHFAVYFVILMGLFMELSYDHTFIMLKEALNWLSDGTAQLREVSDSAITQARQRITYLPLESLFQLIAKPLATNSTPGAFCFGLRLVIIDGTIFDVEDTPENAVGFGRPASKLGDGAYPQVRCVAVIEQATRAVLDVIFGSIATSEYYLAEILLRKLSPGMLCLADRLYPSYNLCKLVMDTGAHFLWRVKKDAGLKPIQVFDDGSYLARMYAHNESRGRIKDEWIIVRVVRYTIPGSPEVYRLITSLLKPEQASAEQLARLYPKRWTEETFNAEIKTTLRKPRIVLRSRKPDQVIQELFGLFIAHYVVRSMMAEAASTSGIPPDSLSFGHSVFVLKTHLLKSGDFSP